MNELLEEFNFALPIGTMHDNSPPRDRPVSSYAQ